jgi:hypothetical protein
VVDRPAPLWEEKQQGRSVGGGAALVRTACPSKPEIAYTIGKEKAMQVMRNWVRLVVIGCCGFAIVAARAQEPKKPRIVISEFTEAKAKVDSVDQAKRLVTFTDAQGEKFTVKAGPAVKNLDQVKAGDELTVKYFESIALFVRKGGEAPSASETVAVAVAPKGKEPEAVAVDTFEFKATVEAVHPDLHRITLKGPDGKNRTFRVHEDVKTLKEIKKGDELVIRHTEALAISIEKPK